MSLLHFNPSVFTNYDALPPEALEDFYLWVGSGYRPIRQARLLFPTKPKGYVAATHLLYCYAINKYTAMQCRLRGDIQAASNYERICELIYQDLPEFARW